MRVATGQKVAGRRPEGWREPLTGRTAVVVDDGIATGSTARAACQVARAHGAARVVLACRSRHGGGKRGSQAPPTNWSA